MKKEKALQNATIMGHKKGVAIVEIETMSIDEFYKLHPDYNRKKAK